MGRTAVFNGLELVIPDAYSALDVSRLLTPTSGGVGIVALVGEADGGKPGLHIFPGGASPQVVKNELKSGPLADMCRLALRSGSDNLVQAGASTVLAFKTNNSTQSTLDMGGVATGVAEVRQFTTRADVSGDLNNTYLDNLYDGLGNGYYIWFNINGAGVDPALAGKTGIMIAGATNASANFFATTIRSTVAAISGGTKFATSGSVAQVIITNLNTGAAVDLVDGAVPTGFTGISTTVQGVTADSVGAIKLRTKQYGLFTAQYTGEAATSSGKKFVTVRDEKGIPEISVGVGSDIYASLQYTGNGSAATATLKYVSSDLKLQSTLTGQSDGSENLDVVVTLMTLTQLKNYLSTLIGYTLDITPGKEQFLVKDLDLTLSATSIKSPAKIDHKASIYELIQWGNSQSKLVTVERGALNEGDTVPGTFDIAQFAGGTRGSTANSDVQDALNELLNVRINILVPLFSSDSQDGSTVTISAINAQVKDHVQSRSSILGRSEAQSYVSVKGSKADFITMIQSMNSRRVAVTSQIVTDLDIDGNVKVFDEYAFAVVCAQTQAGSPIGTDLTYRSLPVIGLSQDVSWDPVQDGPELIKKGALIGGPDENNTLRVIAGYTSWLQDDNNANIYIETVESLDIFSFNHRKFMKQRFLGKTTFTRQDVVDAIEESLQVERDTTKSIKGFDKTLIKIVSATAGRLEYEVAVVPFEGIKFILPTVVAIRES